MGLSKHYIALQVDLKEHRLHHVTLSPMLLIIHYFCSYCQWNLCWLLHDPQWHCFYHSFLNSGNRKVGAEERRYGREKRRIQTLHIDLFSYKLLIDYTLHQSHLTLQEKINILYFLLERDKKKREQRESINNRANKARTWRTAPIPSSAFSRTSFAFSEFCTDVLGKDLSAITKKRLNINV